MSLHDDLQAAVTKIFGDVWSERDGQVVPEPESLKLGNDAVNLDATILYADMAGSTTLVDNYSAMFAAEIYKAYLACAARIIKSEGGSITAYDGDRIMAVFIGGSKNTSAARTAMKINRAVHFIINPSIKSQYPNTSYQMGHTIGIDTSKILVSRVGVRNDNDLVWVGRAANYAAKLSSLDAGYTYVTSDVFNMLHDEGKYGGDPRQFMWEARNWTAMNNMSVYRSDWWWPIG